jgi:acetylornithine deacetylase/succinyl-diaminopimelate desuccinylase-like protein
MGLGRIVHRALGSRRFRIHVAAPGGHSWSDFGSASALHILAQIAADLSRLHPPETPRTTFNIGRMEGGTSVNTIAQSAWLELDLRSEETQALQSVVAQSLAIVSRYQTPKWERRGVTTTVRTIGDRPPGEIATGHVLVRAAQAALTAAGWNGKPDLRISSTDANIPLSRGIPAVCVGVTEGANAHRLEEWIYTAPLPQGMAHLLLLTWWGAAWLAGEVEQPE